MSINSELVKHIKEGGRVELSKDFTLIGTSRIQYYHCDYELQETTAEEILKLRVAKVPCFVLKVEDALFYTRIPKEFSIESKGAAQPCADCRFCTKGCPKVKDLFPETYSRKTRETFEKSKRLEKYDFIDVGYETINVVNNIFSVDSCAVFEQDHKNKVSKKVKDQLIVGLAQHIDINIEDKNGVRRLCKKNGIN